MKILGIFDRLTFTYAMIYVSMIVGIHYARQFIEEGIWHETVVSMSAASAFVDGILAFLITLMITLWILSVTTEERKYTRTHKEDREL
jgi:hypothetical protein